MTLIMEYLYKAQKMKKLLFLILLLPAPAFAYFDLGTGTYLFQIIAASLLGVIYTVRSYIAVVFRSLMFWKKEEIKEQELEKPPE